MKETFATMLFGEIPLNTTQIVKLPLNINYKNPPEPGQETRNTQNIDGYFPQSRNPTGMDPLSPCDARSPQPPPGTVVSSARSSSSRFFKGQCSHRSCPNFFAGEIS